MHDVKTIEKLSIDHWLEEARAYMEAVRSNEPYQFKYMTLMDLFYTMKWPTWLKTTFDSSNKIPQYLKDFITSEMINEEAMVYDYLKIFYMVKHNHYRAERDIAIAEFYISIPGARGFYFYDSWHAIFKKLYRFTGRERG
ncbi:MAG: hypothetical protein LBL47_01320 [Lactobacillus sp.]|jgi:hypothetical protein|nr:hypothetical protein [Lactobacillus sp.]